MPRPDITFMSKLQRINTFFPRRKKSFFGGHWARGGWGVKCHYSCWPSLSPPRLVVNWNNYYYDFFFFFSKGFPFRKNLKSKPKKNLFSGASQFRQLKSKSLDFFQNLHLVTKYLLPEKIRLLTSQQAEIKGGAIFPGKCNMPVIYRPTYFNRDMSICLITLLVIICCGGYGGLKVCSLIPIIQ